MSKSKSDAVALNAVKTKLAANPLTKAAYGEGGTQQGNTAIGITINVSRAWPLDKDGNEIDPMEPKNIIDITPDIP